MSSLPIVRAGASALLAVCCAGVAAAQSHDSMPGHQAEHADHPVQGGGTLPPGWSARTDNNADLKNVKFAVMEPGWHITLGPATILYRATDEAKGPFHTLATFHQMKKLEHPEGYGLFFGGRDLAGPAQSYVYFLVRADGKYLIKRRDGEKTTEITKGWVADPSVVKADAQGKATNKLEIDAKIDPSKVTFTVNGKPVHTADAKSLQVKGIVGLRVNHNLDVHVQDFAVHQ